MKKLLAAGLALVLGTTACFATLFQNDVSVTFIPTISTSAYASGNAIGGLQSVNFYTSATQPAGMINNFFVLSKGGITTAMTVYIFDTNPTATTCTDKSAFSLAAADTPKLAVTPFVLTPAVIGVGTTVTFAQQVLAISSKNQDSIPTQKLYVCLVIGGIVTPASTTDLVATITGSLD